MRWSISWHDTAHAHTLFGVDEESSPRCHSWKRVLCCVANLTGPRACRDKRCCDCAWITVGNRVSRKQSRAGLLRWKRGKG